MGYQAQLDQYLTVSREGKEWIANLEAREKTDRDQFSEDRL
jgi:hypothetical protein